MERYLAKGMPLLSPAQNNSSRKPLNFDSFTDYDAFFIATYKYIRQVCGISLPDMETSNKEAGDLQEEEEIPGIIEDHGIIFIATYKYIRQLCGWWLELGCRAFSAGW